MIGDPPRFRVGVHGAGRQAVEHRIPSLLALAEEGVELVAIADRHKEHAQAAARGAARADAHAALREHGYPVPDNLAAAMPAPRAYASLGAMTMAEPLDGVVTAVPDDAHAPAAIEALEDGLHVLSERPPATSLDDAELMLAIARRHGRLLAIGYPWPYPLTWPRSMLDRRAIGSIHGMRIRWSRAGGLPSGRHCWRDAGCGGAALDLAGHLAAAVTALGDAEVVWVDARSRNEGARACHGDPFAADDTIEAAIRFADGTDVRLAASWADGIPPEEELALAIHGRCGRLDVPLIPQPYAGYVPDRAAFRPVMRRPGHRRPVVLGPPPLSYAQCMVAQARNWVAAARGLEPLHFTAGAALHAERVVAAARASARRDGARVHLAPAEQSLSATG